MRRAERRPTADELRSLYWGRNLSTRQIGEMYGVRHITIRRWLAMDGIPIKPKGTGLANRGVEPPSKEDLIRMIHVEHLGYDGVAKRYGVDKTAVPYWLAQHGIPKPKVWETRYKGDPPRIDQEEVRRSYESGMSIRDIGLKLGVGEFVIRKTCSELGIAVKKAGFNGGERFVCENGLEVRSVYELKAGNWFVQNNVKFDYEPKYPFHKSWKADFHANGWYVEIWGVVGNAKYEEKKKRKIELCGQYQIPLLQLKPHQFSQAQGYLMEKTLSAVLDPPTAQGLLF